MKWPNPEDELLATCSRVAFTEADQQSVLELSRRYEIRWDTVYATARMHGVAPLVYRNLSRSEPASLNLKNGVVAKFKRSFADNLVAKHYLREGLWRILRFFNECNLDVMLIKGGALNMLKNGANRYTVSRDVDLIIRSRKEELSSGVLTQIHQLTDGYPLEFDFYGHHDIDMNGALPIDWGRVWVDAIPVQYRGRDFYIMSQEDALIASCINACRKRYFNLKALCAIDSRLRDEAGFRWNELAEKSHAYQVNGIVYAALVVAERVMGSPVPKDRINRLRSSGTRAAIVSLLSKNLSFSSLSSLYSGASVAHRKLGASLLLPYASYRGDQIWRKLRFAASGSAVITSPQSE